MLYYELGHYDQLYLNHSYRNIHGTGYQLRYVYHNNDSGIVVDLPYLVYAYLKFCTLESLINLASSSH
jgi:hypothetical protein